MNVEMDADDRSIPREIRDPADFLFLIDDVSREITALKERGPLDDRETERALGSLDRLRFILLELEQTEVRKNGVSRDTADRFVELEGRIRSLQKMVRNYRQRTGFDMNSRILLVDDENMVLDSLACMFREIDLDVATAATPAEALRLVTEEQFQMAFVDNHLGPMEGMELIEQLRKVAPGLHFVIMTGDPNIDTAICALKNGIADFLRKPFRFEDLLVSVDHVNRKRELEQQKKDLLAGLELKIQEKTAELKQTYLSVLVTLSRTVEKKDLGTYGHSMRVSQLSARVAERIGLPASEVETVRAASLLHDIGKIGISDFILAKKGPLTVEEFGIIRSHPLKGVEILQPLKQFEALLPAILHHHERYDGSGYPAGLSGDAIPLSARIISVVDTFDAIISDRPYRGAGTGKKAMEELRVLAGKQFDSEVVGAFVEIMRSDESAGSAVHFAEERLSARA